MSAAVPDETSRLNNLESKLAHQDMMITDLNEVITAQWRKIDALERLIRQVRDEAQNFGPSREGPEPPPPHY